MGGLYDVHWPSPITKKNVWKYKMLLEPYDQETEFATNQIVMDWSAHPSEHPVEHGSLKNGTRPFPISLPAAS
jgi:hypothetical protein